MFRTIKDFISQWNHETEATMKVLKNISDVSLSQKVAPNGRSLGTLSWHLIITMGEMLRRTGLKPAGPQDNDPIPNNALEMANHYQQTALSVKKEIEINWNDKKLTETVDMYGEQWTLGFVLYSLILHQAHHRGQITVLMRQAGLPVPGIYGPSREEWSKFGMPPQD
jgi:uncharacterized damage-inducible protein DinB